MSFQCCVLNPQSLEHESSPITTRPGLQPNSFKCIFPCFDQCDQILRFCHLGMILKVFSLFLSNYLVFGKIVKLLWQILHTFGQIFICLNGQILK